MTFAIRVSLALACLATPMAASAQLPQPVRAMIDAAIATGDAQKVAVVLEIARATNPDDAAELDAIAAFVAEQEERRLAQAAAEKERAIREASLFENWDGKGELGAFRSTGNSTDTGVTAKLALTREGIDWRHKLRGRADYQRANGVTTREQFLAAYEPNFRINGRAFVYGLAQYERDRFQGFSARYSVSGGLGYDLIETEAIQLSVQGGPAWRRTERIGADDTEQLAGLLGLDFDWQIAQNIAITQDASAYLASGNSTFLSETGIQASVADDVSVRLSYSVEHDTDPPAGAVKTDTLSRVVLIYDF